MQARTISMATALVAVVVLATPKAQAPGSSCEVAGPPDAIGQNDFVGQAGHRFDYWSDSGSIAGTNKFEKRVRNRGALPLTFNWEGADFFRRGVPPGEEARSQCQSDANRLNVDRGHIMYGPNVQSKGPEAGFYNSQQPLPPPPPDQPVQVDLQWTAILDDGKRHVIRIRWSARLTPDRLVEYDIRNTGDPIEIGSPLLTSAALDAARKKTGTEGVRGNQIVLKSDAAAVFQFSGEGVVQRRVAPVSVSVPGGQVLLYRDRVTTLAFPPRPGG